MDNVLEFLLVNGIDFVLHNHPAVYTCEDAEKHCSSVPGMACKNLFLRDRKGKRYLLLVLPAKKQTDLNKFAELAGEKKVSFASSDRLEEKLGLKPGSVSPLGLINDNKKEVEVYIDSDVYNADIVGLHPNVNTATLEFSKDMFHKFLETIEHKINVVDL